jgi:hypothetical protein
MFVKGMRLADKIPASSLPQESIVHVREGDETGGRHSPRHRGLLGRVCEEACREGFQEVTHGESVFDSPFSISCFCRFIDKITRLNPD